MSHVEEYERGDAIRIKTVFKDSQGEIIQPDRTNGDSDVTIEVEDITAGETIVSETQMSEVSDKQFEYDWQTTEGMTLGEYSIVTRGQFNTDTALNRDVVKLVDIIRPNQGQ